MFGRTPRIYRLEPSQTGIAISRAYLLITYYNNYTLQPRRTHAILYHSLRRCYPYLDSTVNWLNSCNLYFNMFRPYNTIQSARLICCCWRYLDRCCAYEAIHRLAPHVSLSITYYNINTLQPWRYLCLSYPLF
jgi:hypothetical protein